MIKEDTMTDPFIPPEDRVDVIGKLNNRLDEAEGETLRSKAEAAAEHLTDPHELGKPEVDPKEVKEFKDMGGKDEPKDEKEEPKDDKEKENKEVKDELKEDKEKENKEEGKDDKEIGKDDKEEGKDPKDDKEEPKDDKDLPKDDGEKEPFGKEPTDKEPIFEGPDGEPSGDDPGAGGREWRDDPVM